MLTDKEVHMKHHVRHNLDHTHPVARTIAQRTHDLHQVRAQFITSSQLLISVDIFSDEVSGIPTLIATVYSYDSGWQTHEEITISLDGRCEVEVTENAISNLATSNVCYDATASIIGHWEYLSKNTPLHGDQGRLKSVLDALQKELEDPSTIEVFPRDDSQLPRDTPITPKEKESLYVDDSSMGFHVERFSSIPEGVTIH
jgi:hypothetical protein